MHFGLIASFRNRKNIEQNPYGFILSRGRSYMAVLLYDIQTEIDFNFSKYGALKRRFPKKRMNHTEFCGGDLRRNVVTNQAVRLASILSESSRA
ncbi:hypothetical protein BURPS1710A_2492 [Burkholderia pseudomallei 1710a]|uniref:Uncharacterized protein n=1 Tax=Burkholderia pseudomallei 1710a TaxID=320371 RepID=A0A0E1WIF4_BURPE|nr:hypothetical protein BURPS1710A_2492 [Burkholderia pseudomallei 1710a]